MEWLIFMTFESNYLMKAQDFVETNHHFYFVFPFMKCKNKIFNLVTLLSFKTSVSKKNYIVY